MLMQFMRAVKRNKRAKIDQASNVSRQAGPLPDRAPAIFSDQCLEWEAELVGPGKGTLDIVGAEHCFAHFETTFKERRRFHSTFLYVGSAIEVSAQLRRELPENPLAVN